jgi:hypothetical protein
MAPCELFAILPISFMCFDFTIMHVEVLTHRLEYTCHSLYIK